MDQVNIIGLDIAKRVFQAHGADASGGVVFRKKISRAKLLDFFASQPPCLVALEACGGAHYWAREIGKLGHDVKLIAPKYVKPFVKRQKNDAADAEAICEAAQRPTMRFVPIKSEAAQADALVFRTRDLLVRQRTQIINAVRGHLTEYGVVVAKGLASFKKLIERVEDPACRLPGQTRSILSVLVQSGKALSEKISLLDLEIAHRAKEDKVARRLMTIPGVGPDHRHRDRGPGAAGRDVQEGTRFRRLGGAHAVAVIDGRQTETWRNLKDGRANHTSPAHHRGERGGATHSAPRGAGGIVAGTHARTQAAYARNRGFGK